MARIGNPAAAHCLNVAIVGPVDAASEYVALFVVAVGRVPGVNVVCRRESLVEAATHAADFFLMAGSDCEVELLRCAESVRSDVADRLVPMNASRPRIFQKLLERYSIPCAIDGMSIAEWAAEPAAGVAGIFGRKDVAREIGAAQEFFASERYAYLKCSTCADLPAFLVAYLLAARRLQRADS